MATVATNTQTLAKHLEPRLQFDSFDFAKILLQNARTAQATGPRCCGKWIPRCFGAHHEAWKRSPTSIGPLKGLQNHTANTNASTLFPLVASISEATIQGIQSKTGVCNSSCRSLCRRFCLGRGPMQQYFYQSLFGEQTHVTAHVAVHVEDSVWAGAQCSSTFARACLGTNPCNSSCRSPCGR